MKMRPILFSAPMVRALLADRKTMTRRAIKKPEPTLLRSLNPPCSPTGSHPLPDEDAYDRVDDLLKPIGDRREAKDGIGWIGALCDEMGAIDALRANQGGADHD